MRRTSILAALLAMSMLLMPATASAVEPLATTPGELTSLAEDVDGAVVRIAGEVVSEPLRADETHVWLNVLGDGAALGIYMPREMAEQVTFFGDYSHEGDVVVVSGIYHEACDDHGGDMDIHATSLVISSVGTEVDHPVGWWKGVVGVVGLLAAAAMSRRFSLRRNDVEA